MARPDAPMYRDPEAERRRAFEALDALYARVDAALEGFSCEASNECCRFGVTGREPYVTEVEVARLAAAVRARGGVPKRRKLPVAGERTCAMLGDDGRCAVYAARPFGCRTFFCERASGPGKPPRDEIKSLLRELSEIAERYDPRGGRGTPLTKAQGFASLEPNVGGRSKGSR